jgi:hypothetical protein
LHDFSHFAVHAVTPREHVSTDPELLLPIRFSIFRIKKRGKPPQSLDFTDFVAIFLSFFCSRFI